MMARDQPPQRAMPQDRNRHRSADPHVVQVLNMHRRHAAQRRKAQVDRVLTRLQQPHRRVADIRDLPFRVAPVQLARLHRNVLRRKMQPEIRRQHAAVGLGNNLARPVRSEPVHLDPVISGQPPDLLRQVVADRNEVVRRLQCPRCPVVTLEQVSRRKARELLRLLHLQQLAARRGMHQGAPRRSRHPGQPHIHQPCADVGGEILGNGRQRVGIDQPLQRLSQQRCRITPEMRACVGTDRTDPRLRAGQGEQNSMRLDAARNMDRFPVTGHQVGNRPHGRFKAIGHRPRVSLQ